MQLSREFKNFIIITSPYMEKQQILLTVKQLYFTIFLAPKKLISSLVSRAGGMRRSTRARKLHDFH